MPLQTEKEVRRLGLHEQVAANDPVIIEEVVEGMRRMFMEYIWVFKAPLLLPCLRRDDIPASERLLRFVVAHAPNYDGKKRIETVEEKAVTVLFRLWRVWRESAGYDNDGQCRPESVRAWIMEAAATRLLSWLRTELHPTPDLVIISDDAVGTSAAR